MKTRRKQLRVNNVEVIGNGSLNGSFANSDGEGFALLSEFSEHETTSTDNFNSLTAKTTELEKAHEILGNYSGKPFVKLFDCYRSSYSTSTSFYFPACDDREWRTITSGDASMEIHLRFTQTSGNVIEANGYLSPKQLAVLSGTSDSVTAGLTGCISGSSGYQACQINLTFVGDNSYRCKFTIAIVYYDGTNSYTPSGEITMSIAFTITPMSCLAGMTWAEVDTLAQAGALREGDTKSAMVDGHPVLFRVVDATGSNISLTAGGKAKTVWMADCCIDKDSGEYTWDSSTSGNGYASSEIRTTLTTALYETLDSGLKSVIKKVTLKSGKGGDSSGTLVDSTDNTLFLPAVEELYGDKVSYSTSGEGTQFKFFKDLGVTTTNYKSLARSCRDTDISSYGRCYYWLRSPDPGDSYFASSVYDDGGCNCDDVTYSNCVVPCFCI